MGHCTMEKKYCSVELLPDELAAWLDNIVLAFAEPKFSLFLKYRPLDRISNHVLSSVSAMSFLNIIFPFAPGVRKCCRYTFSKFSCL